MRAPTGIPPCLFAGCLLAVALFIGCAPPSAPLFRDYERPIRQDDSGLGTTIEQVLLETGWEMAVSPHDGVLATEARVFRNWVIYRVEVSLEVTPVGADHVRVFVHPFRKFATGGRSKLFGLDRGLRRDVLTPLDQAFGARDITVAQKEAPWRL